MQLGSSKAFYLVKMLCEKTDVEALISWPFYVLPRLELWSPKGKRVFVIGDAAHAIPPTGGQGAAMAVEDAETVAYTLIHSLLPAVPEPYSSDPPTASPEVTTTNKSHAAIVQAWEVHGFARVKKVVDFTTKNGDLRKSSPHFYDQAAKEWLIWAMFKLMGDEGDARWMYRDNAETVRAVLPYRAGLAVRSIYLTIVMKI